jgi:hypothetical protein
MEIKTISIDGVDYVRADQIDLTPSTKQIVVLQRGWIVVGDVVDDGEEITILNASVIRYWGTTQGIGELVNGPTAKTKLDKAGTVRSLKLALVLRLDVDASKW